MFPKTQFQPTNEDTLVQDFMISYQVLVNRLEKEKLVVDDHCQEPLKGADVVFFATKAGTRFCS